MELEEYAQRVITSTATESSCRDQLWAGKEMLRAAGQRIGVRQGIPDDDLLGRVKTAVAMLNEIGGLVELEENDGRLQLCGYSCHLVGLVPSHPEVCLLTQSLIAELVRAPVDEHCEHGKVSRCRFDVHTDPRKHEHNTRA